LKNIVTFVTFFVTTLQIYTYFLNLQIFFALFFEKIENNFSFNSILLAYKDLKIRKNFAFLLQNCNFFVLQIL
jgi:hypothetical protein